MYPVYCRYPLGSSKDQAETVLDIYEDLYGQGLIFKGMLYTTVVDKIKFNLDQSLMAFTVDPLNNEKCVLGVKDMKTGQVNKEIWLQGISQAEFTFDNNLLLVESDEFNRPYKVKHLDLQTMEETVLFQDDDTTHYIDLNLSKDKKFIFIKSSTKEDSEVWVVSNQESRKTLQPELLIKRKTDVRIHIDHIRDFFLIISNNILNSKNFRLQTLDDKHIAEPYEKRSKQWLNMLDPGDDDTMVISEFDCFKDFIAVYVRHKNKPKIIVQDLDSKEFSDLKVNDGDIGEITPMLNQNYDTDRLRFMFNNPFIYHQEFEYNHSRKTLKILQNLKLRGSP